MFDWLRQRRLLIVACTANLCRSPMAQGLLEAALREAGVARDFRVISAGTHVAVSGQRPDARAQAAMARRGVDITGQRALPLRSADVERAERVLLMDQANLLAAQAQLPQPLHDKLQLILAFNAAAGVTEVPDPYFGNAAGFDAVADMLWPACQALVDRLISVPE